MVAFSQARELLLRVRLSGMKIALATSSEKADLAICGKLVGMDDLGAAGCVEVWQDPTDLLLHFDDSALRR
jgi:hypothetical protein